MIQPDDEIGQDGQGCIASPVAVPDYVDAVPIHGRAAAVVNSIAENHLRRQVARAKSADQHCQEKDSLHCSCLPSPPREESVTESGLTSVPAHAREQNPDFQQRKIENWRQSSLQKFLNFSSLFSLSRIRTAGLCREVRKFCLASRDLYQGTNLFVPSRFQPASNALK